LSFEHVISSTALLKKRWKQGTTWQAYYLCMWQLDVPRLPGLESGLD